MNSSGRNFHRFLITNAFVFRHGTHHSFQHAQKFYSSWQSDPSFDDRVHWLSSGHVYAIVLQGHGAVESWLTITSSVAIASSSLDNSQIFYASTSRIEAKADIEFFFGDNV